MKSAASPSRYESENVIWEFGPENGEAARPASREAIQGGSVVARPLSSPGRSIDDIRVSGRVTERELLWLCDLAKTLAACAMSTAAITPAEAERLLAGRALLSG